VLFLFVVPLPPGKPHLQFKLIIIIIIIIINGSAQIEGVLKQGMEGNNWNEER
jgi:hypothetical protein